MPAPRSPARLRDPAQRQKYDEQRLLGLQNRVSRPLKLN
jgi:hypothetical protein